MREIVTAGQIRNLNKLPWDKRLYANFKFADGTWGLEVNYYFDNVEFRYKVVCENREAMQDLRRELDCRRGWFF